MSESSELTRGKRGQGDPDAGITECGGMAGEPGAGESSGAGRLAALARPEEGSKASVGSRSWQNAALPVIPTGD